MLFFSLLILCASVYAQIKRPCYKCRGRIVEPLPITQHKTEVAWSSPLDFLEWHRPMPGRPGSNPSRKFPVDIPQLELRNVGTLELRVDGHDKMQFTATLEINLDDVQIAFESYHPAEKFIYLKFQAELWTYTRKSYVDMEDHTGWQRIAAESIPGRKDWRPEQTVTWTYDAEHPMIKSQAAAYSAEFIYSKNDPIGVRYSMAYTTQRY